MALHPRRTLDLISLCTGGGGLDLAVELALPDARSVLMVEREAFAVGHLVAAMEAGLMAPAPVWSDVRTFDGKPWRGLVDGVIGGIPCQPHSLAGRKRGSLDERDLWSDARRIVVQSRAWLVLIENVAGMLAAGADEIAGAERVWRDLRKLGFRVEGGLFSASEVGAPHGRERLFVLGIHDGLANAGRGDLERWGRASDLPRSAGTAEGEGDQRQRNGFAIGDGREDMADTGRARWASPWRRHEVDTGGQFEPRCGELADADHSGSQGGRRCDDPLGRQDPQRHAGLGRRELENASGARGRPIPVQPGRQGQAGFHADRPGLFPPGPGDLDDWRRVLEGSPDLEPSVRRMADGVAARLDLSGPHAARVERLRMLGNGVVPLQGGYAIRTLLARLAAAGSAAAARLVRLSEVAA